MSRGQIFGRGHAFEKIGFDRVGHHEERGYECYFAAEDEGRKAVAQVVEGKVLAGVQIALAEEREYQGLEEIEEDNDFEADELLESTAGLKNGFQALVESEDRCDCNQSGDCTNDGDLQSRQRDLRRYQGLLANRPICVRNENCSM